MIHLVVASHQLSSRVGEFLEAKARYARGAAIQVTEKCECVCCCDTRDGTRE